MSYIYLLCLSLLECIYCLKLAEGWEYLNIQCRDNNYEPVDWWYIYKPPSNTGPHMETGVNYSYITPDNERRWKPSDVPIFSNSMLRYTLSPMLNEEYADYTAIMEYEGKTPLGDFLGSASRGIMIANSMGGLWIGHTVPGFMDITKSADMFPPKELTKGHMFMCLTLDLHTMNELASAIKQTEPYIKRIFIPQNQVKYFPNWEIFLSPLPKITSPAVRKTKTLNFLTREKRLHGIMLARSPGDARCLYTSFARTKLIVLDIYGHKEHQNVHCGKQFSIRNIDSISLKYPQSVYYITNSSDRMGFAVSTTAAWQRQGYGESQYWTCTGNLENQPFRSMGGLVACVTHVGVWQAFDNLKTKEPDCNN